ncbi:hypothetical protein REPUB_Repub01dG0076800 [Reevesia pubescens]
MGVSGLSRIRIYPFGYIQRRAFSDSKILNSNDSLLPVLIVGAGPGPCSHYPSLQIWKSKGRNFLNFYKVFRKLDGLAEEIQRSQPPVDFWRKFIYCTSLTGSILGSVDHIHSQDFEKVISPISVAHFSQYKLTRLLVKLLENLGFRIFTSEGSYVDDEKIQSKFLVAADGAGSTVRKLIGIDLKGEKDLQKLVNVHFLSNDLGQYLLNERPSMLFFIFNTEAIGVLVAHDLKQGEFVLQICKKLIFKLLGRELSDMDLVDVKQWVMHAEVAERFLCGNNQIILCGDAAHRFPPAGGFGMNTGIQDAHNLAWKIASLLNGVAPSLILATYETERKLIAIFNTALSIQNFRAAMAVPETLGLDPTVANSVHQVINKGVGSILPSLDGIFSIGRSQLSELILNENNPLGSSRLAKLRHTFEEGKSLQLQFPAEDFIELFETCKYLEGALVPAPELATGRRRDYVPCAYPGSRLPHMNVRVLSSFPSEACKRATFTGVQPGSKAKLASRKNYIDVIEVKRSSDSLSWWRTCQMTDKGAILVRPVEHIAWCSKSSVVGDPCSEMKMVFPTILGIKSTKCKKPCLEYLKISIRILTGKYC